jgi:hypothetical protein
MARLYTKQDIAKVLRELRIKPINDMVDGSEAARILTWRAKDEYEIEYEYDPSSIRQHVRKDHFPAGTIDDSNKRRNLYQVEAVFNLPIKPKRGLSNKKVAI